MGNMTSKLPILRLKVDEKGIKKSGENKYANFKYFELADFLPLTKKVMAELGICSRFYIKDGYAYLELIDTETETSIEFMSPVADATTKGQIPIMAQGSQITYMRRYLWMMALELTECDSIDAVVGMDKPTRTDNRPCTVEQITKIASYPDRVDGLLKHYNVDMIQKLTVTQANEAIAILEKR